MAYVVGEYSGSDGNYEHRAANDGKVHHLVKLTDWKKDGIGHEGVTAGTEDHIHKTIAKMKLKRKK